jgi:signal transduction histidine kinase
MPDSERVLVQAPYGRDAKLICNELGVAGFSAGICSTVDELIASIEEGAGAALIGDEALNPGALHRLADQLKRQPPWSDFPLIIMTSGGGSTDVSRYRFRLLESLGNVTLVERPLRPTTLVSSVRAALRARRHQYELCRLLAELAENNRELTNINKDLTRVNRELEEFAYVASHDLQEPLRMVNIYTHLILECIDSRDPDLAQYGGFVRQGVKRMEALIRDLLSFSRAVHAEEVPRDAADLPGAFRDALSVLKNRIEEIGAVIRVGSLPIVRGETVQMTHVFQNIISNALKYRREDVRCEIHISAEEDGDDWIISVRDNGIGFEQQYSERIFGLFKRLHKEEYPGTGLGLAICKRIVERYGGRIWAEGVPGKGAAFYFSLPAAVAQEEKEHGKERDAAYSAGRR